jgi:hypothetical protein
MTIETMLGMIVVLLFMVVWKLGNIESRLKNRFPTEKEQDRKWSQDDPMGHWEAHNDKKK